MTKPLAELRKRSRPTMEAALIAAATAVFAERGYDAATTRAIAEQVGCSEALIQNYFGGKEGLLLTVMRSDSEWEEYRAFFRRPLCTSIEQEASEHLTHVVAGLADRASRLRILMSRALVDPALRARFAELTLRRQVVEEVQARFALYAEAGMLGDVTPVASAVEWLVDMGFQLGFVQPQLLGRDPDELATLTRDYTRLFARAFPWPADSKAKDN